jgi:hypothetical protein
MTKLLINEYVWDRIRERPGIVIGINEELELPYSVAEIIDAKKLGRVGYRKEEFLCRYVKLIVPEDEAKEALTLLEDAEDWEYEKDLTGKLASRIRDALVKRGVLPGGV